ncbi:hypothetical protein LCGC14_1581040 [marine sediment metagenome]|uniref:Uncharacterized protein n=1 Tax=marine sediment metagenome TaxID=412755 RepID=A0A0F9IGU6_9ZZZZ
MATANERFPKTYLSTPDFEQPRVLTIARCVEMEVGTDESTDKKPVLFFEGIERGWPLNATNWGTIAQLTGRDNDNLWKGYQIEIFKTQTQFSGKMVDCARVRAPGSAPQPQPVTSVPQPQPVVVPQVVRVPDDQRGNGGPANEDIPF